MSSQGSFLTRAKLSFERDFVQIPNGWMRDKRLSRRARGLLAELMTHVDGFTISERSLAGDGPEGRDAIATAVAELKRFGYLEHVKSRGRGGKIQSVEWRLVDPAEIEARRAAQPVIHNWRENQNPENPATVKPATENPATAPSLKNTNLNNSSTGVPSTRGGDMDAFGGPSPQAATETVEERYRRLVHQPCPYRRQGGEHVWNGGKCQWCGILPSHRWYRDEPLPIDTVAQILGAVA